MSKVTCRPNAAGCCYMFYMYVSFVHNTCHYNKIYLLTYLLTLYVLYTGHVTHDNVLDLFLLSNQTLVNKVEILSGISDHEISISNISVKAKDESTKT